MTRTMLDVNVDRSGPGLLHDQVAAQIRRAIAAGEAAPGERLPLAKDLAAVLGVNKNTVLRALHILRRKACWSSGAAAASRSWARLRAGRCWPGPGTSSSSPGGTDSSVRRSSR